MSTAFELQVYQNGHWQFDSYFDDHDTVVSEAERMNNTGRYAGVRILEETYKANSNTCEYHVIFSRLGKDTSPGSDWRDQYRNAHPPSRAARGGVEAIRRAKAGNRPAAAKDAAPVKRASPVTLVVLAVVLVLTGLAAVIALRTYAGIG